MQTTTPAATPLPSIRIQWCPICDTRVAMEPYDIGSGPEMSCPTCEYCWGADGQPLHPIEPPDGDPGLRLYL